MSVSTGLRVSAAAGAVEGWDDLVERTPGGSYCHLQAWRTVMEDVLGHECAYLCAWREGDGASEGGGVSESGGASQAGGVSPADEALEGILPLVSVRSRLFGSYLVSMPFLNYGGPVGTPEARQALARAALERARTSKVDLLELRDRGGGVGGGEAEARPHLDDLLDDLTVTGRKITVILPLPDDPEVLWKETLRSKVRSQVRRPMKEGLEARFGADQVEPFYEVFAENMRDLGTPVLPLELFQALPGAFGERVRFCVVYREGEPVAAGCGFRCADEFEITWASALRAHSRAAPNMLLYWRMMERAVEEGARAFNFGRCTPDTGSHRFKSQWGGDDHPLPWAVWSPNDTLATPNPEESRWALAVKAWQKLPVGLTRWLGPPLARRIP